MLFKPSASKVAKEIYSKAPSIAGTVTAAIGDEYSVIKDRFGDGPALTAILIDITAESLMRGVAVARGESFAHKVGSEYNKLAPTLGALAEACVQASAVGMSQERGMAEIVLEQNQHLRDPDVELELERFIVSFRQKALEIVAGSS
jgi:hypothetical protein